MIHAHIYATTFGAVLVESEDGAISRIAFGADDPSAGAAHGPDAATNACANELLQYLAGRRRVFSVPCAPDGSAFERAVWDAARDIPYGQTRTCSDIADAIGRPQAHRQVGRAAAACPCIPVIGAHRIMTVDDALSERLRALERAHQ